MAPAAPRIVNSVSCVKGINRKSHFPWQAQYLVKFNCHFSWQAQSLVKFGMIAGARNVVFFHTKCSRRARRVTLVAPRAGCGLTVSWSDHGWSMVGSCSDHGRIILGSAAHCNFKCFQPISLYFGRSFFVAGAVFGDVGG